MMADREPGRSDGADQTSLHVRQAVAGSRQSVGWLVERLSPLLVAQAEWRLGEAMRRVCDPRDLVQDAWLTLLPRLDTLHERDGRLTPVLLRYLSTAILHRVQNLLRREARRLVHDDDLDEADAESDPVLGVASEATGVVTDVLRSEREDRVHAALAELSASDREAIVLRGIEQQPLAEVAEHFEVTTKTMSKRYSRALQRLRERLPDSVFSELVE